MNRETKFILLLCAAFGVFFAAKKLFFAKIYHALQEIVDAYAINYFIAYLLVGIPVFVFIYISSKGKLLEPLGLSKKPLLGIGIAFLFATPMLIGYGILSGFDVNMVWKNFWFGCVFAAFFEELYYRGFFFGQLFKNTKLGFFPALILSALIFASLHLYQSSDFNTLIGIFMTTFLGAGLFAWLYAEWDYNLWVPVGLHFFMNLSWEMFAVAGNAFGDLNANIIRGLTIFFAVAGTLVYKKRKNLPLAVNRRTLWIKKQDPEDKLI